MIRKKRFFSALTIAVIMMMPITAYADTISVSGVDIVNNTAKGSDYKLTNQQSNTIADNLNTGSQYNQVFANNNGRYMANLSQDYSYLINNNIISRGNKIVADSQGVTIHQPNPYSMPSGQENTTNFLMGLYKATYGDINSRQIVFKYPSVRDVNGIPVKLSDSSSYKPAGYNGTATTYDYKNGDYYVYVSPNVPELYLTKLLNMGVIQTSQIKDQNFLEQFKLNGSNSYGNINQVPWSNNAQPYEPLTTGQSVQALGSSWNIQVANNKFVANRNTPNFMMQPNITTMQALNYVASVLRVKDNNLSAKEEKIIAYKYGCSYILELPKKERDTLAYLLAMGVINFQSPKDFRHLYSPLTKQYAIQLLYRVANKAGRIDFKKIVMTDSDNVWMKKGFVQQPMQVMIAKTPVAYPKTISVTGSSDTSNQSSGLFSNLMSSVGMVVNTSGVKYQASSSGNTKFTIVKEFSNPTQASYLGTEITGVTTGCSGVTSMTPEKNGAMEVTFQIEAPNATVALEVINSRITLSQNASAGDTIQTLTKISGNNTSVSYISQADLISKFSDIQVLNDKTLRNKTSGAMAEFLTNDHMALVGNLVVHSPDPMVQLIDGQVYYNMKFVLPLLGNASISKLDPAHLIVAKTPNKIADTSVTESGNSIQKVQTTELSNLAQGSVASNGTMYDMTTLTHGVDNLMRNYQIANPKGGTPFKATVIVKWSYSMPQNNIQAIKELDKNDSDFNFIKATQFLFTRPEGTVMQNWWDSNIGLSNALANLIYGTTGGKYIQTGYLAPSVTVLCNTDNPAMKNIIYQNILAKMPMSGSYASQYLGGNEGNWWKMLFNQYGSGPGSRRHLTYIGSSDNRALGTLYNDKYFVTNTGDVYGKISEDPRLDFNGNSIVVNGRTAPSNGLPSVGNIVSFNKQTFFVKDLQDVDGKYYMALASTSPVSAQTSGTITGNNTGDMYSQLAGAIDGYVKGLTSGSFIPSSSYSKYKLANSYLVPIKYIKKNGTYFAGGAIKTVTTSSKNMTVTNGHNYQTDGNPLDSIAGLYHYLSGTLYGNPVIYLSANDYSVLNGFVVKNQTNPYLELGNVYYSGLNNAIITSVIGNSEGGTSYTNIPNGAKVIIADSIYQMTSNGLDSYPISNGVLATAVADGNQSESSVRSAINKFYVFTSLFMSGRVAPFTTYIKSSTIGGLPSGITSNQVTNTLFESNGSLKFGNGTKVSSWSGQAPTSVCINLKLQPGVNFVCINKSANLYELETMANILGSNGQVGGGLFTNQLYFFNGNSLFSKYTKALFSPLPNYKQMWSKFQSTYHRDWWKNLAIWVKTLCTLLLAYLMCIFLYAYIVVRYGVGSFLFEALNLQRGSRDDGNGVDIISILTFGLLSIEEDPPPISRAFGFFLLLFIAMYIVQYFI